MQYCFSRLTAMGTMVNVLLAGLDLLQGGINREVGKRIDQLWFTNPGTNISYLLCVTMGFPSRVFSRKLWLSQAIQKSACLIRTVKLLTTTSQQTNLTRHMHINKEYMTVKQSQERLQLLHNEELIIIIQFHSSSLKKLLLTYLHYLPTATIHYRTKR